MAEYRIVDAERWHVGMLDKKLRAEDVAEAISLGLKTKSALWKSFRSSVLRKTAFVDGEIAAMWGMGGNLLSDEGRPWLATAAPVEKVPIAYVKIGKMAVSEMLSLRSNLRNVVPVNYPKAVRFVRMIGFSLSEPLPFGPNGDLFHIFSMRR